MRSALYLLPLFLLGGPALRAETEAPAEGLELSFETTAVSRYLWRGFVVNHSPSLQPSVTVGYRGLSVNLWSNISRTPSRNQAWTESDITIEYARQVSRLNFSGGFTDYQFVDTPAAEGNRSSEFYAGIGFSGPLNPSFKAYRDIKLGRGYYYSASINKEFRLPHGLLGATTLAVGVNQHLFEEQTTISNIESTTSVEIFNNERVVIAPFVTVTRGNRTLFGTHAMFGLRAVLQR